MIARYNQKSLLFGVPGIIFQIGGNVVPLVVFPLPPDRGPAGQNCHRRPVSGNALAEG
jgi:hypothetical protein